MTRRTLPRRSSDEETNNNNNIVNEKEQGDGEQDETDPEMENNKSMEKKLSGESDVGSGAQTRGHPGSGNYKDEVVSSGTGRDRIHSRYGRVDGEDSVPSVDEEREEDEDIEAFIDGPSLEKSRESYVTGQTRNFVSPSKADSSLLKARAREETGSKRMVPLRAL